jgi:hypothetical protein
MHYARWAKHGDPLIRLHGGKKGKSPCTVDGCTRPLQGHGYCSLHYYRWRKNGDPHKIREDWRLKPVPVEDRFWQFVPDRTPGKCWEWLGARNVDGYGQIGENGRNQRAHRISWRLKHGYLPANICVCHRCDNPCCVNPDHLFLGDHFENMADKGEKGRSRSARGASHHSNRLSEDDVLTIRGLLANGATQAGLARQYRVGESAIGAIKRGKNWRWLK